jgi:CheY-like chemotaxis protein
MADLGQIEQVLMNLTTNARDAMPAGGILTIETELVGMDDEYIKMHGYGKPGKYALISVSDTGAGMDEKTREKIFEPFFTTKEIGKGTGLGLSIVYGIVKQHGGYINVYSELGKGTTFKIYLPLIESVAEQIKPSVAVAVTGGSETVLLAEDDASVRRLTKAALEEFGYKIIEAEDGEDAINKFMENKDRIQLFLLDAVMPKKSGKAAYEEIKKIKPDIKALFMSGYSTDILSMKRIVGGELNFIVKPVSPTELLKKIREVLDK